MQSTMAEVRPLITPHRLSLLPSQVLAEMVVRQNQALHDLLRGGADGTTSGARLLNAAQVMEDGQRLHIIAAEYSSYEAEAAQEASEPAPQTISPRVAAACLIAVIGIIAAHWAWSATL